MSVTQSYLRSELEFPQMPQKYALDNRFPVWPNAFELI